MVEDGAIPAPLSRDIQVAAALLGGGRAHFRSAERAKADYAVQQLDATREFFEPVEDRSHSPLAGG